MKNWVVLFLVLFFFGCQVDESEEITEILNNEPFDLNVPEQFSWSAISQDVLLINIVSDGAKTFALDSTRIELYNEQNELLDALVVIKGQACFNFRIPATTDSLKIKSPATKTEFSVSSKIRSVNFEAGDISAVRIKKVDTDKDGLFDQFDDAPRDPDITIVIDNSGSGKKSGNNSSSKHTTRSFYIFEDLWPSKGDYDFNDFIAGTGFSWKRGKDNYIREISGTSDVTWNSPGFGLGFELFEAKGSYLIYPNDVIAETGGDAIQIESITNGFKVYTATRDAGYKKIVFTIKIKERGMTDFVCVPFLFRNENIQHQIRPFGTPPTQMQQMQLFKSADDDSPNQWDWKKGGKFKYPLAGANAFYRSRESYPWAIEFMATEFDSTVENISILKTYPGFKTWAESGGTIEKEWYNQPFLKQ